MRWMGVGISTIITDRLSALVRNVACQAGDPFQRIKNASVGLKQWVRVGLRQIALGEV